MSNKRHEPTKDETSLTQDIQAYVKKRADKQDERVVEARKHVEIQLLLSELENLLLNMSPADSKVIAARTKLLDLKIAFYKTLDIK
jgi:hypothetical protein